MIRLLITYLVRLPAGLLIRICIVMKKRGVPAALHSELTEYAFLRALRTRDAMDLTAYLTMPSPVTTLSLPSELVNNKDNLDELLLERSAIVVTVCC